MSSLYTCPKCGNRNLFIGLEASEGVALDCACGGRLLVPNHAFLEADVLDAVAQILMRWPPFPTLAEARAWLTVNRSSARSHEGPARGVIVSPPPPHTCPSCGRGDMKVLSMPHARSGSWHSWGLICRCGGALQVTVEPAKTYAEMVCIFEPERRPPAIRVPVKEPAVCPYCGQPVLRLERRYTVRQVDGDRVVRFHPSCAIETASQIRRNLLQEASLYPRGQELVPPELR
jgi:DNA-directed RNA polymerase subunit RPC12/RpoP